MTGTITIFNDMKASGVISTEQGLQVSFEASAVLAYDAVKLAVGQSVTFDIRHGSHPKASNISVEPVSAPRFGVPFRESAPPRYLGFQQGGNARTYLFERVLRGEARIPQVVIADMSLFAKHHVGLQEGPALCLRLLAIALNSETVDSQPLPEYMLTDRDMLAYLADRPAKSVRH